MHVPPLIHAMDLQAQVNTGSLKEESVPLHPVQTIALVHPAQILLQAKFPIKICILKNKNKKGINFK